MTVQIIPIKPFADEWNDKNNEMTKILLCLQKGSK